jgi:CheY-like chemotaxis protein
MTRILIADDDRRTCELLAGVAAEFAATAHCCHDGLEALAALRSGPGWDLVFVNRHLPRLDGLQLLQVFRRDTGLYGVPVVVTSGSGGRSEVNTALAAGASSYLALPFSAAAVRRLCEEHLGAGLAAMV